MFKFDHSLMGENFQTFESYKTTESEVYTHGTALKLSAGKLTKAGATDKPQFISAENYTAPAVSTKEISVYPIMASHVFETEFSADGTAIHEGEVVTLDATGAGVTATKTNGVATIYKKLGTGAAGSKVLVRFI